MSSGWKNIVRQSLIGLGIPLTRNIRYDILTKKILRRQLKSTSSCIDVGAHKGEILDLFLKYAPQGKHIAFEPIPSLYSGLQSSHGKQVTIYPYALGSRSGNALFNHVVSDPAYSGLQQRKYKNANPVIEQIEVSVRKLDEVLADRTQPVDLIKIDVEGGELDVLQGSRELLTNDKPLIIFEFGKGASEYYGTMPHHMQDFLDPLHYSIRTLNGFYHNSPPLSAAELERIYTSGSDYYFVASPKEH